ncbi:hypothetical protein ACFSYH_10445 [Populibacterium corticicola]|uniref:Uncharacterized protein n=1 Tax=Populibacterium corticicola TaxID=1812826 RepID=A0ABW5XH76_9MICO
MLTLVSFFFAVLYIATYGYLRKIATSDAVAYAEISGQVQKQRDQYNQQKAQYESVLSEKNTKRSWNKVAGVALLWLAISSVVATIGVALVLWLVVNPTPRTWDEWSKPANAVLVLLVISFTVTAFALVATTSHYYALPSPSTKREKRGRFVVRVVAPIVLFAAVGAFLAIPLMSEDFKWSEVALHDGILWAALYYGIFGIALLPAIFIQFRGWGLGKAVLQLSAKLSLAEFNRRINQLEQEERYMRG